MNSRICKVCVFVLVLVMLCTLSVSAAEDVVPPDEVLTSVRQASEQFQFCYKSDGDIYDLFRQHYPELSPDDYTRFFVTIPTNSLVVYFIPDDCVFSGTASILKFDRPCLKLTYVFTSQSYSKVVIQPTTYFSAGNTAFRNFDILVDDAVILPQNMDYFYAVNVSTPEPTQATEATGDTNADKQLDMIHADLLLLAFGVFCVLGVLLAKSFNFWKW